MITWEEFATLSFKLAEKFSTIKIDAIVGIARAGLFPATFVACALRKEMYPVRITRRVNDVISFKSPIWKVPMSPEVSGKFIAVIDEIADSGETLNMVANEALKRGASRVVTACLINHSWANPKPTFSSLITDELVIFPWDQKVLTKGKWQLHPEIARAIKLQNTQ